MIMRVMEGIKNNEGKLLEIQYSCSYFILVRKVTEVTETLTTRVAEIFLHCFCGGIQKNRTCRKLKNELGSIFNVLTCKL